MATHAQVLKAITDSRLGMMFTPRFPGTCALTGVQFNVWGDKIRAVETTIGTVYVLQRALEAARIYADATENTHRPFDVAVARAWLEDTKTCGFHVLNSHGQAIVWKVEGGLPMKGWSSPCTWAEFGNRTRGAQYMVRVPCR